MWMEKHKKNRQHLYTIWNNNRGNVRSYFENVTSAVEEVHEFEQPTAQSHKLWKDKNNTVEEVQEVEIPTAQAHGSGKDKTNTVEEVQEIEIPTAQAHRSWKDKTNTVEEVQEVEIPTAQAHRSGKDKTNTVGEVHEVEIPTAQAHRSGKDKTNTVEEVQEVEIPTAQAHRSGKDKTNTVGEVQEVKIPTAQAHRSGKDITNTVEEVQEVKIPTAQAHRSGKDKTNTVEEVQEVEIPTAQAHRSGKDKTNTVGEVPKVEIPTAQAHRSGKDKTNTVGEVQEVKIPTAQAHRSGKDKTNTVEEVQEVEIPTAQAYGSGKDKTNTVEEVQEVEIPTAQAHRSGKDKTYTVGEVPEVEIPTAQAHRSGKDKTNTVEEVQEVEIPTAQAHRSGKDKTNTVGEVPEVEIPTAQAHRSGKDKTNTVGEVQEVKIPTAQAHRSGKDKTNTVEEVQEVEIPTAQAYGSGKDKTNTVEEVQEVEIPTAQAHRSGKDKTYTVGEVPEVEIPTAQAHRSGKDKTNTVEEVQEVEIPTAQAHRSGKDKTNTVGEVPEVEIPTAQAHRSGKDKTNTVEEVHEVEIPTAQALGSGKDKTNTVEEVQEVEIPTAQAHGSGKDKTNTVEEVQEIEIPTATAHRSWKDKTNTVEEVQEVEKSNKPRLRKRKQFSGNWIVHVPCKRSKNCVCNKHWKTVDFGFMIECEVCRRWYHLSCLQLPPIPSGVKDENILFTCGQMNCNSSSKLVRFDIVGSLNDQTSDMEIEQTSMRDNSCTTTSDSLHKVCTNKNFFQQIDEENSNPISFNEEIISCTVLDSDEYSVVSAVILPTADVDTLTKVQSLISTSDMEIDQRSMHDSNGIRSYDSETICKNLSAVEEVNDSISFHKEIISGTALNSDEYSRVSLVTLPTADVDTLTTVQSQTSTSDMEIDQRSMHDSNGIRSFDSETICKNLSFFEEINDSISFHEEIITGTALNSDEYSVVSLVTLPTADVDTLTNVQSQTSNSDMEIEQRSMHDSNGIRSYDSETICKNLSFFEEINDSISFQEEIISGTVLDSDEYSVVSSVTLPNISENSSGTNIQCYNTLTNDDLHDIFGVEIPDKKFTFELCPDTSFYISSENWQQMKSHQKKRCFKAGTWQHIFLAGIKQSNSFCSFVFDYHKVNALRTKKETSCLFSASAHCSFLGCPVTLKISLNNNLLVSLKYQGNVSHDINESRCRPIRGTEREMMKSDFSKGMKPLKKYLETFKDYPIKAIVAGNFDGIGVDTHVLRQISSESRQHRLDTNCIESLMLTMEKMKCDNKFGFIQKVSICPFNILYWSIEGLKIYHKLGDKFPLYWDATGNVVRRGEDGKKFLYYELTIANSNLGNMGIPVAAMISNDQSLPTIVDWIESFRHGEKKIFGHSNLCQPRCITSDQSWVFILAALKVLNNESLDQYLMRLWSRTGGCESSKEQRKANVHLCMAHVMNNFKKFAVKNSKKNVKFALHGFGLLMNSRSLEEASHVLYDLLVAFQIPTLTDGVTTIIDSLLGEINTFNVDIHEHEKETVINENRFSEIEELQNLSLGRYDENDFLTLADMSPFKKWGYDISEKVRKNFMSDSSDRSNVYFSEIMAKHLLKKCIPIFPMWSSITDASLSSKNSDGNINRGRTNNVVENRFRLLKHLSLGGNNNYRLDDISYELFNHTVSIQKLTAANCLKKKLNSNTKKTRTISEKWNKKATSRRYDWKKFGRFQKPPKQFFVNKNIDTNSKSPLSSKNSTDNLNTKKAELGPKLFKTNASNQPAVVDSVSFDSETEHSYCVNSWSMINIPQKFPVCGLKNIKSSCWLNCCLQAVQCTFLGKIIVTSSYNNVSQPTTIGDVYTDNQAYAALVKVFRYICCPVNWGSSVPEQLLLDALTSVCNNKHSSLLLHQQNDASDLMNGLISHMAEMFGNNLLIERIFTCTSCPNFISKIDRCVITLPLTCENTDLIMSIQDLIYQNLKSSKSGVPCSNCSQLFLEKSTIVSLPLTLCILIKRYQFSGKNTVKILSSVVCETKLDLSLVWNDLNNSCYKLRSIICHTGVTTKSGHYVTYIYDEANQHFVRCDDLSINAGQWENTLQDCYMVLYDRISHFCIETSFDALIKCLSRSEGIKWSCLSVCQVQCNEYFSNILNLVSYAKLNDLRSDFKLYIDIKLAAQLDSNTNNDISIVELLGLIDNYIYEQFSTNASIAMDSFSILCNSIMVCQKCNKFCWCGQKEIRNIKLKCLADISAKNLANYLADDSIAKGASYFCLDCKQNNNAQEIFITCLPQTLTISISDSSSDSILSNDIPMELDIMTYLKKKTACALGKLCFVVYSS